MGESVPPKRKKVEEPKKERNPLFVFEAPSIVEKKPVPEREF